MSYRIKIITDFYTEDIKKAVRIDSDGFEKRKLQELTCIVFNNAHEFDVEREFVNFGLTDQSSFESFEVDFQICGSSCVVFACCFSDSGRFFSINGDDLAGFDDEGSAVNAFSVNVDVTMVYSLFCCKNGGSKTATIDESIKTLFEAAEKFFVSKTGTHFSFLISDSELFFADSIMEAEFLFFDEQFAVG